MRGVSLYLTCSDDRNTLGSHDFVNFVVGVFLVVDRLFDKKDRQTDRKTARKTERTKARPKDRTKERTKDRKKGGRQQPKRVRPT